MNIPTELLLKISDYLTADEKRVALITCKNWYQPLRHSLYSIVHINNISQLGLFFDSLQPNGHIVKQIYIENKKSYILYIHEKQLNEQHPRLLKFLFQKLPYLCPNLEILEFDTDVWKDVYFYEDILKWKYIRQLPALTNLGTALPYLKLLGRNLTTLSVQSTILVSMSTKAILDLVLSLVPNLTKLVIRGDEGITRPVLRLDFEDIELIHSSLPYLKILEITGNNIQMINDQNIHDLARISKFPTAKHINTFHLNTRLTSIIWVAYVTHKYASTIEHLKLNIHYPQAINANQDHRIFSLAENNFPTEKSFFLNLVERCKRLKTISLSCPILDHWLNDTFFQVLSKVNPGIREVNPLIQQRSQIKFDSDFRTAKHYGKHLMTALEIEQWELDALFPNTLHSLSKFTRLTHLELNYNSSKEEFSIESVLDSCPLLETLVLLWGTIYISSFDTSKDVRLLASSQRQHPLKTLKLELLSFESCLFEYLSRRCGSLTNLYITKCRQLCKMNDMVPQTKVRICMPNNRLKNIMINAMQLDYSAASRFFYKRPSYIKLASISTSSETNWYHHKGYEVVSSHKQPVLERLSKYDSDVTQAYLVEHEKTKFTNSSQFLGSLSMQKLSDTLKIDLIFGCISIECKSVNNFLLDGNIGESLYA